MRIERATTRRTANAGQLGLLLLPLLLTPAAGAQTGLDEGLAGELPGLMETAGVPGLSIAVIRKGEIAWHAALGVRSAQAEAPVDADTLFQAASLSKPVVAYTVLRLVDQGLIDLDTPLSKYFAYEDIAGDERAALITARHVLSHSTGFPNWRGANPLATEFSPGERHQYSGEGFVYLQRVLEHLTGLPLAEVVAFETLEPLEMAHSSFVWTPVLEANHATGHDSDGATQAKRKPQEASAAGTLHTTAREYARFMIALMTGEGLERETHAAMLSAQVDVASEVHWGLGVGLQDGSEGTAFWQWGDDGVFKAFMAACPKSGSGVVYFTNSEAGLSIAQEVVGAVLGAQQPAIEYLGYARSEGAEDAEEPDDVPKKTPEKTPDEP